MARRGQSLMELARLGNVGGDIRLGQWHEKKRKEAERALSSLTDKAKKAASGDYKGEKWLEAGKFISNFIPVYGKAINMALSGIDILADKAKAKKGVREFKRLSPQSKGPYGDYLSQNFNALLSQVEQTQKASAKQSLLSNLMSIGGKSGITDKLGPVEKETLGKMFPQMGLQGITPGENILNKFLSKKLVSGDMGITDYVKAAGAHQLPSLYDYFELLQPRLQKGLRGRGEATSPAAPYMQRPSIRRRIR